MSSSSDKEMKRRRIVEALKNRKPTVYEGESTPAPEPSINANSKGRAKPVTAELIGEMVDENPAEALAVVRRWMSQ